METTVSRITNGPQILCRMCGAVCNHVTGLCAAHRPGEGSSAVVGLTEADRSYLEWKRHKPRRPPQRRG